MKRGFASFMPAALALLSGCAAIDTVPPTAVHQPMSVRPDSPLPAPAANGAIYQAAMVRPLFEDRRARHVGDIIAINLVERNNATKNAKANATRGSSMTGGITASSRLPLGGLAGLNVEAGVDSDFTGTGGASANNAFNGTITVTVIDVYPNGNLLASGEKVVAINQGNEFIRFSGVIDPNTVTSTNTVQSTQVADARIEYRGSGFIEQSNAMGWMQRFFLAISPF